MRKSSNKTSTAINYKVTYEFIGKSFDFFVKVNDNMNSTKTIEVEFMGNNFDLHPEVIKFMELTVEEDIKKNPL